MNSIQEVVFEIEKQKEELKLKLEIYDLVKTFESHKLAKASEFILNNLDLVSLNKTEYCLVISPNIRKFIKPSIVYEVENAIKMVGFISRHGDTIHELDALKFTENRSMRYMISHLIAIDAIKLIY